MKRIILFFILILAVCNFIFAQESEITLPSQNVVPPSPTAAALGKYGEIPVSNYTGIPSINENLYVLKGRRLSVPISLSYHAGGHRVDEVASWVGLGWSLNAGGAITRSVRGLEDENTFGYRSQTAKDLFAELDEFDDLDFCAASTEVDRMAANQLDGEPDLFNFNIAGGYSGRFVIDQDENIRLIPEQDIKVEQLNRKQFKMTTPDGTIYLFGAADANDETTDYYEETTSSTNQTNNSQSPCTGDMSPPITDAVTAWFLREIRAANGTDKISFEYERYSVSYTSGISATRFFDNLAINPECRFAPNDTECANNMTTDSWRISSITSDFGEVKFTASTNREDLDGSGVRLEKVEIFGNTNGLLKTFTLGYDYYNGSYIGINSHLHKRLKLRSITETAGLESSRASLGTTPKPPTIFTYLDDENTTYNLPPRLSYAQDHWGFYNGADGNNTLLPAYVFTSTIETFTGANRDTDIEKTKAGMLSRITYPTGGYTDLAFEVNSISGNIGTSNYLQASTSRVDATTTAIADYDNGTPNDPSDDGMKSVSKVFDLLERTEITINVQTSNTQGINWEGEITLTDQLGNAYCISDGGDIPCAGNVMGQREFLDAGIYTLTATAMVSGDKTKVTFDWEELISTINEVPASSVVDIPVGGVRIAKMTDFAGEVATIREFKYNEHNGTASSGELVAIPRYAYSTEASVPFQSGNNGCQECSFRTLVSTSKAPLGSIQGSHVAYPHVTIVYGENGVGGRSEMEYTYFSDKGGTGFPYSY